MDLLVDVGHQSRIKGIRGVLGKEFAQRGNCLDKMVEGGPELGFSCAETRSEFPQCLVVNLSGIVDDGSAECKQAHGNRELIRGMLGRSVS